MAEQVDPLRAMGQLSVGQGGQWWRTIPGYTPMIGDDPSMYAGVYTDANGNRFVDAATFADATMLQKAGVTPMSNGLVPAAEWQKVVPFIPQEKDTWLRDFGIAIGLPMAAGSLLSGSSLFSSLAGAGEGLPSGSFLGDPANWNKTGSFLNVASEVAPDAAEAASNVLPGTDPNIFAGFSLGDSGSALGAGAAGLGALGLAGGGSSFEGVDVSNPANWGNAFSAPTISSLSDLGKALSGVTSVASSTGLSDLFRILGAAAPAVLGAIASNQQGNQLGALFDKYWGMGAPSRARFEGSFAPGFDITTADPALQPALDTAASTTLRSLSGRYGNPSESPAAQYETQKALLGNFILPQLNTYRSQNLTGGQMGTNTAGTFGQQQVGTTGNMFNAIGAGINDVFNPKPTQEETLTKLASILRGGYG